MVPLLIIERFGRRKVLLSSVAGVAIALLFMGVSVNYVSRDSVIALSLNETFPDDVSDLIPHFKNCAKLKLIFFFHSFISFLNFSISPFVCQLVTAINLNIKLFSRIKLSFK